MKKIIWIILFISCPLAYAVKVTGLYQAEISVISKARDVREDAIKEGFLHVLLKLSGNAAIDQNPLIHSAFRKAEYYVSDFTYLSETKDSSQYALQINYEPGDINRLLNKANIAYWGENRPLVLVWLVVTNSRHEREIVGNEFSGSVYFQVMQESKKFGLPVIFPVMDMDEIEQVSPDDVANLSIKVLETAGKRYSPEALLIGDISENEEGVQSKWQLMMKDTQWNWKINNKSVEGVISFIMSQVSQTLVNEHLMKRTNA